MYGDIITHTGLVVGTNITSIPGISNIILGGGTVITTAGQICDFSDNYLKTDQGFIKTSNITAENTINGAKIKKLRCAVHNHFYLN